MQIPVRAAAPKLAVNQLITLAHTLFVMETHIHKRGHTQEQPHAPNQPAFLPHFQGQVFFFFLIAVKLQPLFKKKKKKISKCSHSLVLYFFLPCSTLALFPLRTPGVLGPAGGRLSEIWSECLTFNEVF